MALFLLVEKRDNISMSQPYDFEFNFRKIALVIARLCILKLFGRECPLVFLELAGLDRK